MNAEKKFSQQVSLNIPSCKSCPATRMQNSRLVQSRWLLREVTCLLRKKKGEPKVLFHRFCLFDSKAEKKALTTQLLNQINKIPRDKTLDLPTSFLSTHIASPKNQPSLATNVKEEEFDCRYAKICCRLCKVKLFALPPPPLPPPPVATACAKSKSGAFRIQHFN